MGSGRSLLEYPIRFRHATQANSAAIENDPATPVIPVPLPSLVVQFVCNGFWMLTSSEYSPELGLADLRSDEKRAGCGIDQVIVLANWMVNDLPPNRGRPAFQCQELRQQARVVQ